MTFAIGGASFESFEKAYEELGKLDYKKSFRFNKLGLSTFYGPCLLVDIAELDNEMLKIKFNVV